MLKLEMDFKQMEQMALRLGASVEQVPFAMSVALNKSAEVTRNFLIKHTWPSHIKQRNQSFIAASLTTKDSRASKQSLSVEIYDRLQRGNLKKQALGGTRTPKGGGHLAVPSGAVRKGAHGVSQSQRPRNLQRDIRIKDLLYVRTGKGKRGRLKLMYTLRPATRIPRRVPFYIDFEASMRRELARTMPLAVKHAMATRR